MCDHDDELDVRVRWAAMSETHTVGELIGFLIFVGVCVLALAYFS